jgi:eukaryotic-like serine/threonine-protein kinase
MRYRPIIALGQGGMAEVHLAVGRGPNGFNKLVVLKSMRKELVGDEELRQMFLAEARVSARLNNANVVHVHEVLDTSLPCIVMEYLEGQPLSSVLREGGERFSLPLQIKVLSEALSGLHYSHELKDYDGSPLNLVHRDVSPQNIFITYDCVVKVLDFGIAKATSRQNQTRTGVVKGKLPYMAREQLLCGDIDRRADIYSIGCILWQAAAGKKLWSDTTEGDVMRALIDGQIPKPSQVRPVDPMLEKIVMKALSPEPDDRYPTALAMRRALDEYLSQVSPGTTMREVGELVSELFADQQVTLAQQIQQLVRGPYSEAPPRILNPTGTVLQGAIEDTRPNLNSQGGARKGLHLLPALTVGVLVAAGTIGFTAWRDSKVHAPNSAAVVQPPRSVQVRLVATPAAATLFVDGNTVSGNPAQLVVPPDNREHTIRAVLKGYEPHEQVARFDRDLTVELMLIPAAPPSAPPSESSESTRQTASAGAGKSGRPNAAPTKSTSRGPTTGISKAKNCDPPYTFENGIKTYKTGCLLGSE